MGQDDSQPREATYSTSFRDAAEIIEDEHASCLPGNLRAGRADVVAGFCLLRTLQCLLVYDAGGRRLPGDGITLARLQPPLPDQRFFTLLALRR